MTSVKPQIFQFQLSQINTQVRRQLRDQIHDQIWRQIHRRVWSQVLQLRNSLEWD